MSDAEDQTLAGRTLLLLPRYTPAGPSSRLRMGQFVPLLEQAGATIKSAPFFDDRYLAGLFADGRRSAASAVRAHVGRLTAVVRAKADLVWIEKELFPFLPGPFERALRARSIPYVVDIDDAVFHRYDRSPCRPVRWIYGRKLAPLMAGAAAVTPGNDYLANYARSQGARRIVRVPTVVDPTRYPQCPPPDGPTLRLGWIGTPDNARYLALVAEGIRRLNGSIPITLVTIGAPLLPDFPAAQEAHEWSEAREGELLSTIDVGVMPLKDNSYERGKCGYKLIQYMASGRPVIGSPVGVNREIVTPDVGLLAADADGWANAIRALATDAALRHRMGTAGRAQVEGYYSTEVAGRTLVDLFADIIDGRCA